MAEAAVETRTPNRFFCHQCSVDINPDLPDYTCPRCQSGFIEEITEREEAPHPHDNSNTDPAAQFAELFGQAFLQSFTNTDQVPPDDDSEDDGDLGLGAHLGRPLPGFRARPSPFHPMMGMMPGARISIRTHNQGGTEGGNPGDHRNQAVQSILQSILGGLMGGAMSGAQQGTGAFPFGNMLSMYGNPGDYAWGSGGLDNIITQLLNQIEGTGPPPANKDDVDQLEEVQINNEHTEKGLQCSVCMEDFSNDEKVKALPCEHLFHPDCILPWLELHGTCPVCRKPLSENPTSQAGNPANARGSNLRSSNRSSSRTRSQRQFHDDEYD